MGALSDYYKTKKSKDESDLNKKSQGALSGYYSDTIANSLPSRLENIIKQSNELYKSYTTRFGDEKGNFVGGYNRSDSSSEYKKYASAQAKLNKEISEIAKALDNTSNKYDPDTVSKIKTTLSDITNNLNNIGSTYKFYSDFNTEYDYNAYVMNNTGNYDADSIKNRDTAFKANNARIDELNELIENFKFDNVGSWGWTTNANSNIPIPSYTVKAKNQAEYDALVAERDKLEAQKRIYGHGNKVNDDIFSTYAGSEDYGVYSKNRDYDYLSDDDVEVIKGIRQIELNRLSGNDLGNDYKYNPDDYTIEDPLGTYLNASEDDIYWAIENTGSSVDVVRNFTRVINEGEIGGWEYLKPEEVDMYYYLWNKGLKDEAKAYLKGMEVELDRRANVKTQENIANASALELVFHNIASIPAGIIGGAIAFVGDAFAMASGEEINPYAAGHDMQNYAQGVRGVTANKIDTATNNFELLGTSFGDSYQSAMSGLDSLAGGIAFGGGYAVLMGMGAASSEAKRLYEQGASNEQIAAGGILAGATEMIFEKVSIDHFLDKFVNAPTMSKKQFVLQMLAQGGIEASEEVATEIANTLSNTVLMGSQSDWKQSIEKYKNEGYSDSEAIQMALKEIGGSVWDAGVGGLISGIMLGGGGSAINLIGNKTDISKARNQAGADIVGNNNVESLIAAARNLPDTPGYAKLKALAEEMHGVDTSKLSKSESKAFSNKVGKLYSQVQEAQYKTMSTSETDAVKSVITEKLKALGITNKADISNATKAIFDTVYRGKKLSSAQSKLLDRIGATKVASELMNESTDVMTEVKKSQMRAIGQLRETQSLTKDKTPDRTIDTSEYSLSDDGKTYVKGTGEAVTITGIQSIKNGDIKVNLSNGKTESISNVDLGSQDDAIIYQGILDMGIDAASASLVVEAFKNAPKGTDATTFIYGVQDAIKYGKIGGKAYLGSDAFTSKLTEKQRNDFYRIGEMVSEREAKNKAKAIENAIKDNKGKGKVVGSVSFDGVDRNSLNERQKVAVDAIEAAFSEIGINVVFFQSPVNAQGVHYGENGSYDPTTNTIRLDISAGLHNQDTILFTAAHELTHFIAEWSDTKFKTFADFLIQNYAKHGVSVDELIRNKIEMSKTSKTYTKTLTETEAFEEVVCDACESFLRDSDLMTKLTELAKKDMTLFERIKDYIDGLFDRLKKAYAGLTPDSLEANEVLAMKDCIGELRKMWVDAAMEARENFQAAGGKALKNTTSEGDVIKFSLMNRNTFESNVDAVLSMNDKDALLNAEEGNFVRILDETPRIITDNVKDAENLEVIISFYSLYLAARKSGALEGHYHNLGDLVKNLPEYIANPQAIVRMNSGRLNLFTQIKTPKGENGILSIELNSVKDINNKFDKYNLVITVYSANDNHTKNNIVDNGVKVEYEKEDLMQVNPQLCKWLAIVNKRSSKDSIDNPTENVKENSSKKSDRGLTETKETEDFTKEYLETKSLKYNLRAVTTHRGELAELYNNKESKISINALLKRYDKIVDIWEELGGELDSKFLKDWNDKKGKDRSFTIFKAQSGYKYNVELSSMCKKGVPLFEAIDRIVKDAVMDKLNTKTLGKAEKEILYDILKQHDFEIPCAICYVEQARQREGDVIDAFLNGKIEKTAKGKITQFKLGWNEVLNNVAEEMKKYGVEYTFPSVDRAISTENYTVKSINMDESTQEAFYKALKTVANKEITRYNKEKGKNRKLVTSTTPSAIKECFGGTLPSNLKIFKALFNNPNSRFLIESDLLYSSMTTQNLAMLHKDLYSLFNSQGGVSGYKTKQGTVVYWGDILKKKWSPSTIRGEGGVRNQSNSDFQMFTLLDQAQMYIDFSAKGYYMQAYTKVLSELKLFGLSRAKINASLIPKVVEILDKDGNVDIEKTRENAGLDKDGNLLFDDFEGINHKEAFMLIADPEYSKNICGICIGYSDNHIFKMLDDDRIQLIIGFHDKTNDADKRYRGARYAKNYNGENEVVNKNDGETVHVGFNKYIQKAEKMFKYNKSTETYEGEVEYNGKIYIADDIPRLAADMYLADYDNGKYTPAYATFKNHPNYYKLLADFGLYDSEGHYAPHRKVVYNMPGTVPCLDKNGEKTYVDTKDYIKAELEKELAVRDSISEALDDTSENGIIPQFVQKVNELHSTKHSDRDSAGNTLTSEQIEFFKDSVVRDKNGNLLVVRHGTGEDFHIFDFSKSGKNGKAEGYGFYFSDEAEITKRYGDIQKEVYLNITKPLYNNKRTIKKAELIKFTNDLIDFDLEKWKDDGLTWQDSFISNYVNTYEFQKSKRYAVQEFVNMIWESNENDQDLIFEVAQADGRMYENSTMKEFYDILTESIGYDGIIAEWSHSEGKSNVYVTFNSEQSKYTSNKTPTTNPDMRYSDRVTNKETLDFLNNQIKSGNFITTYKSMRLDGFDEDGNPILHSPMATEINGKFENEYELGNWYQAVEHPELIKFDKKNGLPYFELDKGVDEFGDDLGKVPARYNPYEHSSNYVINDQFKTAFKRPNLVVVEMRIPLSEISSGYQAQYAKDPVGWQEWKKGDVAAALAKKGKERQVLLSRWAMPYRILTDTEVAQQYKDLLSGTGVKVPNNVVTPSLLSALEDAGVEIDYNGIERFNQQYAKKAEERAKKSKSNSNVKLQARPTESVSNRSLLANALESTVQNEFEKNKLTEYKNNIDRINAEEKKLSELRKQIHEMSFAPGKRDAATLSKLRDEAIKSANRISMYDKKLLSLEASKPLKDVLQREKVKAVERQKVKDAETMAAYRKYQNEKFDAVKKQYQESRQKAVEGRHRTELRNKIKKVVNDLNQYLLKGTKDKHVMIGLQKSVAMALDAVNMDTVGAEERVAKYNDLIAKATDPDVKASLIETRDRIQQMGDRMNDKLDKLKSAYEEIKNSDDPDVANAYDEVIENAISSVISDVGETSLRDMTYAQLESVYDLYTMILTRVRGANESFKSAKNESITKRGSRVTTEVERTGGNHPLSVKMLDAAKGFAWNTLKPTYAFETIGSETLTEAYENVRSGEDTWATDVSEAKDYYKEKTDKYGFDSWDFEKRHTFKSTSGISFELSLEQIMSLYAYSKRKQAGQHLQYGGFVFDDSIEVVEKKHGVPIKYTVKTANAHNLSLETLAEIVGTLTPEQKSFVDEMQEYLSAVMGAKGNEVSLAMYGVKLFKEKFYFPLKSAKQFLFEQNQTAGEVRIKNAGFTKDIVPEAKNPVILSNFTDVWSNHVNDMAMYHSFVLALEDFNRIFNYKTPVDENVATSSVKSAIQNAYGKQANDYIKQLITDLNGGARVDSTTGFLNKFIGKFKKASVFASASVVVQQPSAIGRAFAIIDPKYFTTTPGIKNHKAVWDEVKKYAPVAIIKEMGYFDTHVGKQTTDWIKAKEYKTIGEKAKALFTDSGFRDDVLSKAPALADEITWGYIWQAVKKEVAATTNLKVGSEEYLQRCGKRFTEVVTKTQVYDSVLARSGMMRSNDTGMKMVTAFMGEPTTSLNMLTNALIQGKRGNKRYARNAVGGVVTSMVLNSILVAFVYAARDDDEDETYLEKYVSAFSGQMVDNVFLFNLIPWVKDIWSTIKGYDVERSDMSVISDIVKSFTELDNENKSPYRKVEDFVGAISSAFGLPAKNIMRDVRSIYNVVDTAINGGKTTWYGIEDAIIEGITGDDVSLMERAERAMKRGDSAAFNKTVSEMIQAKVDDGKTEKEAKSAVRSSFTSTYKKQYVNAVKSKNWDEMTRIRKLLYQTGVYGTLSELDETLTKWRSEG